MSVDNAVTTCVEADPITALGLNKPPELPCRRISGIGETETKRGGVRLGSGRPAITDERPWQAQGISRATYYRRQTPAIMRPEITTPQWFVIAYWRQAEISGTRELTRQGYETYLPLVAVRRRDAVVPSMYHILRLPLLGGYGFIRMTQTESREPILMTRGIRGILLRPDGKAAVARDAEVELLMQDDDARLLLPRETAPAIEVGQTVRIEAGAFIGHLGPVLECDGVKTRVEIQVFGRPTPIWLDRVGVAIARARQSQPGNSG